MPKTSYEQGLLDELVDMVQCLDAQIHRFCDSENISLETKEEVMTILDLLIVKIKESLEVKGNG
jgi:hypothetical protein